MNNVGSSYRARARRARAELQFPPPKRWRQAPAQSQNRSGSEALRRFETSFYGSVSGYNFVWLIQPGKFNLALPAGSVTEISGTGLGVPNRRYEAPRRRATALSPWILPNEDASISRLKCFQWWET
jgi:hypothetical protein